MAQKVITTFVDDIDGTEGAGTVVFGWEGRTYEIDLSAANTEKIRKAIEPFVAKARVAHSSVARPKVTTRFTSTPKPVQTGPNPTVVREWAAGEGAKVLRAYNLETPGPRGRIAQTVVDLYLRRAEEDAKVAAQEDAKAAAKSKPAPKAETASAVPSEAAEGTVTPIRKRAPRKTAAKAVAAAE